MDKAELIASLEQYRVQISALEEGLLAATTEEDRATMRSLMTDMIALLEITQSQLLDMERAEELGFPTTEQISIPTVSAADEQPSTSNAVVAQEVDEDEEEEEDFLNLDEVVQSVREQIAGIRCRAPYAKSSLPIKYHNSIVLDIDEDGSNEFLSEGDVSKLGIRVLYSNPMTTRMTPCPHFLNESCHYGDKCKYSHGELVAFGQILEYVEPDFESIEKGSMCIVRDTAVTNNKTNAAVLWKQARVTSISHEENKVAIKFLDTNREVAKAYEDIIPSPADNAFVVNNNSLDLPPESNNGNDPNNGASFVNETEGGANGNGKGTGSSTSSDQQQQQQQRVDSALKQGLGNWEEYTTGIGSKLMAKMGYVFGEGLGRDGRQGIVNPVEATLIPKGKGVDFASSEGGQAGRDGKLIRRRKRKHLKSQAAGDKSQSSSSSSSKSAKNATESDIFNFLNHQIGGSSGGKTPSTSKPSKNVKNLKETSCKSLNIRLFEMGERERKVKAEIGRYQQMLQRNDGKNHILAERARSKLADLESSLVQLSKESRTVKREQATRKDKKKLSIF